MLSGGRVGGGGGPHLFDRLNSYSYSSLDFESTILSVHRCGGTKMLCCGETKFGAFWRQSDTRCLSEDRLLRGWAMCTRTTHTGNSGRRRGRDRPDPDVPTVHPEPLATRRPCRTEFGKSPVPTRFGGITGGIRERGLQLPGAATRQPARPRCCWRPCACVTAPGSSRACPTCYALTAHAVRRRGLQLVRDTTRQRLSRAPPPPPCVTFRRLLFLDGALDSHPFFPSPVAPDRCILSAAAAGAPAGVVSAFAEPNGWCAGAVLVVAGAVCALAVPSSWRTEVVLVAAGVV